LGLWASELAIGGWSYTDVYVDVCLCPLPQRPRPFTQGGGKPYCTPIQYCPSIQAMAQVQMRIILIRIVRSQRRNRIMEWGVHRIGILFSLLSLQMPGDLVLPLVSPSITLVLSLVSFPTDRDEQGLGLLLVRGFYCSHRIKG
jgi:hypothetical protein